MKSSTLARLLPAPRRFWEVPPEIVCQRPVPCSTEYCPGPGLQLCALDCLAAWTAADWTASCPGLPKCALDSLATPFIALQHPGLPFTLDYLAPWTWTPWTSLPCPRLPCQALDCLTPRAALCPGLPCCALDCLVTTPTLRCTI